LFCNVCGNADKDVDALATNSAAHGGCQSAPKSKYSDYVVQSEDVGDSLTSEVLSFVDSSVGDEQNIQYVANPIASADSTSNTDLARFLSRPTLIDARSWSTATATGYLGADIEPWYLYLNNSVIKQKLTNYAYLRAKLCVNFCLITLLFRYKYQGSISAPKYPVAVAVDQDLASIRVGRLKNRAKSVLDVESAEAIGFATY